MAAWRDSVTDGAGVRVLEATARNTTSAEESIAHQDSNEFALTTSS